MMPTVLAPKMEMLSSYNKSQPDALFLKFIW